MKLNAIFGLVIVGLMTSSCSTSTPDTPQRENGLLIAVDQNSDVYATQENSGVFNVAGDCVILRLDEGAEFTPLFNFAIRPVENGMLISTDGSVSIEFGQPLVFGGSKLVENTEVDESAIEVATRCGKPLFRVGPILALQSDPPTPSEPELR